MQVSSLTNRFSALKVLSIIARSAAKTTTAINLIVDLGGGDVAVAEEFLDLDEVHAGVE